MLERVLVGENIGDILGSKAKRGRPCSYEKAILVHASVRALMLDRQRLGRRHRRDGSAKEAVAEAFEMSIDTVRENYKRVSGLIKKIKDDPFEFDLERNDFSFMERAYLRDQENAFLLLDTMDHVYLSSEILESLDRPEWLTAALPADLLAQWQEMGRIKRSIQRLRWETYRLGDALARARRILTMG